MRTSVSRLTENRGKSKSEKNVEYALEESAVIKKITNVLPKCFATFIEHDCQ